MQRDLPFIAHDPAVMRHRRYVKQIACMKLNYAAILKRDCRGSRQNKPDMFNGATSGPHTWPDVLAPFPSWLIRRATNCDSAEVDQLKFPFLHYAHVIRDLERFQNDCYLRA